MSDYHHIQAVVPVAVVPCRGDDDHGLLPPRGTPLSDRARPTVSRIGRGSLEVRDALWAVLDAIGGLERTVDWMQGSLTLRDHGVKLSPELLGIGADGVAVQHSLPFAPGDDVRVYMALDVRDVQHLMSLRGTVESTDDGGAIAFRDLRGDERDLIVAFVFQQEAKERRRARSTAD